MSSETEFPVIRLRLVEPSDVTFILSLRRDPNINRHLSYVEDNEATQRRWIEDYKERERQGKEYYFLIETDDGVPHGTIRLSNFVDDYATWGSYIVRSGSPPHTARIAAMHLFDYAFNKLKLAHLIFDVRRENTRAFAYYESMGAIRTGEDDLNYYYVYKPQDYETMRAKYAHYLVERKKPVTAV